MLPLPATLFSGKGTFSYVAEQRGGRMKLAQADQHVADPIIRSADVMKTEADKKFIKFILSTDRIFRLYTKKLILSYIPLQNCTYT